MMPGIDFLMGKDVGKISQEKEERANQLRKDVMALIETNFTQIAFDDIYDAEWFKNIEKQLPEEMKRGGVYYTWIENQGKKIPLIIISTIDPKTGAAIAGIQKFGEVTEARYSQAKDAMGGKEWRSDLLYSSTAIVATIDGTTDAIAWYYKGKMIRSIPSFFGMFTDPATKAALANGANYIDVVVNLSYIKNNDYNELKKEISRLVHVARKEQINIVLEASALSRDELEKAVKICIKCKVDFIMTNTGFGSGGATPELVQFLKEIINNKCGIKVAGGITTREEAWNLLRSGASIVATSREV